MGYFDDDEFGGDFMGRTPRSSYFEIAKNANANVVEEELDTLFRRLAVAEKMLEDRGLDEELENQIRQTMVDKEIDERLATVYIDLVGAIVTKCE